jgi:monoterpene epsilon-lactone hydrolase
MAAYRYLLEAGYRPEHIAFAGESAGGNLSAAMILKARDLGLPRPGAYVGFSPWFDLLGELPSFDSGTDAFLLRPASQSMASMYLNGHDPNDPLVNPRLADLTGFPRSYVTAGGDESLVDAVTAFADKAKAAQVDITVEVVPDVQHAFQVDSRPRARSRPEPRPRRHLAPGPPGRLTGTSDRPDPAPRTYTSDCSGPGMTFRM